MSTGMILTRSGRELLGRALAGETLTFTRAFIGDGDSEGGNSYEFSGLISPRQELPVQSIRTSQTGTAEVVLEMSNRYVTQGFFVREYGLFAKVQGSEEILYSYCNKGDEAPYLEAYDGTNPINYTLSMITVIDQAQNITAIISTTNNYITRSVLEQKVESLFAESDYPPAGFFTFSENDSERLRPMDIEEARRAIMGLTDIRSLISRADRVEDAINQILLALNAQSIFPGARDFIAEDFVEPDNIDRWQAYITSIVAGDDSIDVQPLAGMIPGAWYTISDGSLSEAVQAESINLENGIQRVILTNPVKNTYKLDNCRIYRTSAAITSGKAAAPDNDSAITWEANTSWKGRRPQDSFIAELDAGMSMNPYSFTGNMTLSDNGGFTLKRS